MHDSWIEMLDLMFLIKYWVLPDISLKLLLLGNYVQVFCLALTELFYYQKLK